MPHMEGTLPAGVGKNAGEMADLCREVMLERRARARQTSRDPRVLANNSLGVRRQGTEGSSVASKVSSSSVSSSQPSQGVSSVSSTSSNRSDVSKRTWQRRTNCVLKRLLSLDEFGRHKLLSRATSRLQRQGCSNGPWVGKIKKYWDSRGSQD